MTETKTVEVTQADVAAMADASRVFGQAMIKGLGPVKANELAATVIARHRLASQSLSTDEEVAEAVAVFQELMTFDLMAKWTREGRQDFRDVMTRAKAAFVALQSKDTPSHG